MSTISEPPEFDFWDVVCCSRCQLPFSKQGPVIPFWLTECGHVLCNNHLNPDQSCMHCGSQGVQVMPLQRELEAPMSDWFRSIPTALDIVAYAAKFQQEMMASQILFFRTRHQQQRMIIDRLKNDVEELKKMNENLRRENSQIRQQFGEQRDQALQSLNSNGKRSWDESHQLDERFQKPRTNASPNAAATSIKPHRHTFTVPHERAPNVVENQDTNYGSALATRRLAEQYSYKVPSTPLYHAPALSHEQAAPHIQRNRHLQESSFLHTQNFPSHPNQKRPLSRFKPGKLPAASPTLHANVSSVPIQFRNAAGKDVRRSIPMGPPPTPQHSRQRQGDSVVPESHNAVNDQTRNAMPVLTTNRFLPSTNGQNVSMHAAKSRSFMPPTPFNGKT